MYAAASPGCLRIAFADFRPRGVAHSHVVVIDGVKANFRLSSSRILSDLFLDYCALLSASSAWKRGS